MHLRPSLSSPETSLAALEQVMEVETVIFYLSGHPHPAFITAEKAQDIDFESLPADGHLLPQDLELAVAGALGERRSLPEKLDLCHTNFDLELPVKQVVHFPAVDPSAEKDRLTVLEDFNDLKDYMAVPPMSAVEMNETILAPSTGSEAKLEAGGAPDGEISDSTAATKLQKAYRSYRTRRRLADSAVVAEELWWQALDFARLNQSTISFFDYSKPETVVSRWNRVSINASKVGQGLSKDGKALKLAFQHWIEAIDPRHRYGHNLHMYYEQWCNSDAGQPFFYWLDLGDGKNVDLKECPRSLLREQCIKYMGPHERVHYEYVLIDGKIVHKQTGEPLDTTNGPKDVKWIFVMSTSRRLYAGVKKRGMFQHSSFLAGGSTLVAGRFIAEAGYLKAIWPYSGHYKPSAENLNQFLNYLKENGINLTEIEIRSSASEDYDETKKPGIEADDNSIDAFSLPNPPRIQIPFRSFHAPSEPPLETAINSETENGKQGGGEIKAFKRTLSGGLRSSKADVSKTAIRERIKSKMESRSYQLGHQVSMKWSTGAGPRIGCVADYPMELRMQALEFTNLSPKWSSAPARPRRPSFLSPTSQGAQSC